MTQIDLNAVVARLDVNQIAAQLDVNALIERVDIDAIVQRTQLEAIVTRASAGVASEGDRRRPQCRCRTRRLRPPLGEPRPAALERSQWAAPVAAAGPRGDGRRDGRAGERDHRAAERNGLVAGRGGRHRGGAVSTLPIEPERDVGLQGTYAGFVTRFAGFLIDIVTIAVLFTLGAHVVDYLVSALRGPSFSLTTDAPRLSGLVAAHLGLRLLRLPPRRVGADVRDGGGRAAGGAARTAPSSAAGTP